MTQSRISDNWSLQDISNLFSEGLESSLSEEIVFTKGQHSYRPVVNAIIQTEALFDFLTDLILCDEILVDEKFTSSWERFNSPILEAKEHGIVCAYPFLQDAEMIAGPRDKIVENICSTQSLREAHQRNVEEWGKNGRVLDEVLSAILWGGAGMCARSFVFEKSYTPHPLRKRLFINSGFMLPVEDSRHQLTTFISDKKVNVSRKLYGNDSLCSSYINIPAIPIRIIQESSTADQIISTALEMRDDFKPLRNWLSKFQSAMSAEDLEGLIKYRKQLDSVSEHIDKKIGYGSYNSPVSMEIGVGIFKISVSGNPVEYIKNQFGIRATLNKLILGGSGKSELQKFIKMFGGEKTKIGYEIEHAFLQNF